MDNHRIFLRLTKVAQRDGLHLSDKHVSPWFRLLAKIPFVGRHFSDNAVLLCGDTIFFPNGRWCRDNPEEAWKALANRMVMAASVRRWTPVGFALLYLFPQSLAVLALGAVGGDLRWLLAMLFLLPLPAPFRKAVEVQVAAMGLAIEHWLGGSMMPTRQVVRRFTGPQCYYMWPFRRRVHCEMLGWVCIAIDRRTAYKLPYAAEVRFAIRIESGLR